LSPHPGRENSRLKPAREANRSGVKGPLHVLGIDALHNNVFGIKMTKMGATSASAERLAAPRARASGTRDVGVRLSSKANGTGALRQFVSKATRPKLPGGLLLSPGLSLRVPRALSDPGVPDASCTAGEPDPPDCRASWDFSDFRAQ
jgi:hypothetical protein